MGQGDWEPSWRCNATLGWSLGMLVLIFVCASLAAEQDLGFVLFFKFISSFIHPFTLPLISTLTELPLYQAPALR